MRVLIATDAWRPQVNGVVRSLEYMAELAPQFTQVPDLYEAYNRACTPAALPDFLTALSTLVAKGVLK